MAFFGHVLQLKLRWDNLWPLGRETNDNSARSSVESEVNTFDWRLSLLPHFLNSNIVGEDLLWYITIFNRLIDKGLSLRSLKSFFFLREFFVGCYLNHFLLQMRYDRENSSVSWRWWFKWCLACCWEVSSSLSTAFSAVRTICVYFV